MQKLKLKKKVKKSNKKLKKKQNPLLELLFNLFKQVTLRDLKKEFKTLRIILESKENEIKIRFEEEDETRKIIKKGENLLLRKEKKKKKLSRTYVFNPQEELVKLEPLQEIEYSIPRVKVESALPLKNERISIQRNEEKNLTETLDFFTPLTEETLPLYAPEAREDQVKYEEEFNPFPKLQENENYLLNGDFVNENLGLLSPEKLRESIERIMRYNPGVLPKFKQIIYKRIAIKNALKEGTVYDALLASGLSIKVKYDRKFDALYVVSINGIRENPERGLYWEYYINGQIGKTSIDKAKVREGDVIEWRLGTSVCGYA